ESPLAHIGGEVLGGLHVVALRARRDRDRRAEECGAVVGDEFARRGEQAGGGARGWRGSGRCGSLRGEGRRQDQQGKESAHWQNVMIATGGVLRPSLWNDRPIRRGRRPPSRSSYR